MAWFIANYRMASRRRQFLRVIAVGGVSAIAGCSGSESSDPSQPTSTPQKESPAQPTATPTSTPAATPDQLPDAVATETSTLSGESDPAAGFGQSIAISDDGTTAIVGAIAPPNWGFVFERVDGTWDQQATLDIDLGGTPFGVSVGLSGDGEIATVGGFNGRGRGRALAFRRAGGTWDQAVVLDPRVAARDELADFGRSIDVSRDGDTILVGGIHNRGGGEGGTGTVFVFRENENGQWYRNTRLNAPGDGFGGSVSLSDDGSTALVGAWNDADPNGFDNEVPGSGAGSAHIFSRTDGTWSAQSKLAASDGDPDDHFGNAVDLSGDGSIALIGAFNDEDPRGERGGSAYLFANESGEWLEVTKFAADDGDSHDQFGNSVAVSGDGSTVLVGAATDEDPNGAGSDAGSGAGSAYVFTRPGDSWAQQTKLAASDGAPGDFFGISVALPADGAPRLVGTSGDGDVEEDESGSAYVFTPPLG